MRRGLEINEKIRDSAAPILEQKDELQKIVEVTTGSEVATCALEAANSYMKNDNMVNALANADAAIQSVQNNKYSFIHYLRRFFVYILRRFEDYN